ncbi:MAG TPA: adenylate kinase [Acidimicrobiales bacterium]|jgi:adenylate kinase|nr:adenylate kinase [Acidimicrobiales bacterium]
MIRLLLLAPPGGGKGTQGRLLAAEHGVPHVSTGDLLRDDVARSTPLGRRVRPYLERGDLIPDGLVLRLVQERLTKPVVLEGFVLDGFPRTLDQALAAYAWATEHGLTFSAVVHLAVPDAELERRVLERGRRTGRSDDTIDTVRHRLAQYRTTTEPLLEFYRERQILVDVDGNGPIPEVAQRIRTALEARGLAPAKNS